MIMPHKSGHEEWMEECSMLCYQVSTCAEHMRRLVPVDHVDDVSWNRNSVA